MRYRFRLYDAKNPSDPDLHDAQGEMLGGPGCKRELSSTETVATGALAGAIASILTTPADVMKTRIMTLPAGQSFQIGKMVIDIAQREGFAAFFKGAVPRMFWIAPLGAMNFAGYELAKNVSADVGGLSDTPPPPPSLSFRGDQFTPASYPLHTYSCPFHHMPPYQSTLPSNDYRVR